MVYLLESIDFYVMPASKVELKVFRLQGQINIFNTALMFCKQNGISSIHKIDIDSDEDNDNEEFEGIDTFLESTVIKYTAKVKGQCWYFLYGR